MTGSSQTVNEGAISVIKTDAQQHKSNEWFSSQHPVISVITWLLGSKKAVESSSSPHNLNTTWRDSQGSALIRFNLESSSDKMSFENVGNAVSYDEELNDMPGSTQSGNGSWGFYVAITPEQHVFYKKVAADIKSAPSALEAPEFNRLKK